MGKTALYIKTFQPPHLGHVEDIKYLTTEHDVTNVLLGVGSSKQHHLFEHPFTLAERKEMLELLIENELSTILSTTPTIHAIPDTRDIAETHEYIQKNLPPFDLIVTNNKILRDMCKAYGIMYVKTPRPGKIYGDPIRHQITLDNKEQLQRSLTPSIQEYIAKLNAKERMRERAKEERIQPKLAVDSIIMDKYGYVTMIERRDDPVGLAFPGGMIEYGDTIMKTARKESDEEVHQDITITHIGPCIDDPYRDPRAHTFTFPVYATAPGTPTPGDDADEAFKIHIEELYARKDEVVLGGDKTVEKLYATWVASKKVA